MERYLFTADGYRCVDGDGSILYESEQHIHLFDFVDKDETLLCELLRQYVHIIIDMNTLTPLQNDDEKRHIYEEMRNMLVDLHPFCTKAYLDREIITYFNDQLALHFSHCIAENSTSNIHELTEHQYKTMFDSLFPYGFASHENIEDEHNVQHVSYYMSLQKKLHHDGTYNALDIPFDDIQKSKSFIKSYLYWVLDIAATPFRDMTFPQRLFLYNAYHHADTFRIASINVDYYWGNEDGIRFDENFIGFRYDVPLTAKLPDGQYMADVVQGITSELDYEEMDAHAKKLLNRTIAQAKKNVTFNEYYAVYNIDDLFTLLFIECQRMYKANIRIRRCEYCGHYFVSNKQFKYCKRLIDGNSQETCRDAGPKETAKKKLIEDPVYRAYNKAYGTHHARIRAGRITKQEFGVWAEEAKWRMNKVLNDPSLFEEYKKWLKI